MIVPMKKVAVLTQSKDSKEALKALRKVGVLHVEHAIRPAGGDTASLEEEIGLLDKVAQILDEAISRSETRPAKQEKLGDWKLFGQRVIDLHARLLQLAIYSSALKNLLAEWTPWGDFEPESLKALEAKNIYVRFYRVPRRELKHFPSSAVLKIISAAKGYVNCAVISREREEISFKELAPPKMSIKKMKERIAEDRKVAAGVKKELLEHIKYKEGFEKVKNSLEKELEFRKALGGMGKSGGIAYLAGYAPRDCVKALLEKAKEERWGISVKEPSPEDKVPTLIRNPRWISVIAPVFKVIDIIPGYNELDISLWFLIFLSVFFGMLIGDAGYGIIFFILTFLAERKWGKRLPSKAPFTLFYLFSLCAVIWGVLTGTFFGQEWHGHSARPLVAALRNSENLQALCFLIGTIHLSIAHIWRAIMKLPSFKALSDAGWLSILWGAFFLARTLILGENFPHFAKWFFIAGPLLVVFFTNPSKNILRGIGGGVGVLLLNFVNTFTDIVSYIRLFAVGLATVAIADAFNKMAFGIGYGSLITGLFTSLILFLGHALNILLGPLAVLVHGVRLNVLEFSSHLDIKWSGFSYKPLKE